MAEHHLETADLDEIREDIVRIFSGKVEGMKAKDGLMIPERTYIGTELEYLATEDDFPVEVDGKTMNANIQGSGEVVVLIVGRGVTSPSYDMAPLIDQLKSERTVKRSNCSGLASVI